MPKLLYRTKKLRAVKVVKSLLKHHGNAAAVAREKGISRQAVHKEKRKPEVQEAMQQVIDRCLADAGITTQKVYNQLNKQLQARRGKSADWIAQDKARESALELMRHKRQAGEKEQAKPTEIHLHYGYRKPRVGTVRD